MFSVSGPNPAGTDFDCVTYFVSDVTLLKDFSCVADFVG